MNSLFHWKALWLRRLNFSSLPARLISASELQVAFEKERDRTDRGGHRFAVIVFSPSEDSGGLADLSVLTAILERRMRTYDTLGQLDGRRTALLMPETDSEGAWILADEAVRRLENAELNYSCEVYTYPSDWSPPPDSTDIRSRAHSPEPEGLRPQARELSPTEDDPALKAVHHDPIPDGDSRPGPRERRPVGLLEDRFLKPIPLGKRAFDICAASVLLTLLSPLLALVAILVKIGSRGPIIFQQARAGIGGKPFEFLKFRTMYPDAEQRLKELRSRNIHLEGPIFKDPADPRITPVGKFLRRWSLDELPQLWNVLRGDMSLVGPRPPKVQEVEHYEPWQRRRLDVTGGLTCIWQVNGRSEIGFRDWVRMDLEYIRRRSAWLDFKLLLLTFRAVVSGRGAY